MRTFSRVFNIISGLISIVLLWIIAINVREVVAGVILNIVFLFIVFMFEVVLSKVSDKDFEDYVKITLVSWILILLLIIITCHCTFKEREAYDKAIDAYNNGRYEEALDGFVELGDMYDVDDYLENVVRLKGTDVEVVK